MSSERRSTPPIEAAIFDTDGGITDSARPLRPHGNTFDDYLRRRAETGGEACVPFDAESVYRRYVDDPAERCDDGRMS